MSNPAEYLIFYDQGDDAFGQTERMIAATIGIREIKHVGYGLFYFRTSKYPLDEEELDGFRYADQIMERKSCHWLTIIKGGVK